jgi:starch synthase
MKHILMIAAENGALKGCKVGGIADVLRDLPMALADQGCRVSVVTPSYGFLHHRALHTPPEELVVHFGGEDHTVQCYRVRPDIDHPGVSHHVIDSPRFNLFDPQRNIHRIYVDDAPDQPFASDATKFAFFGMTVAEALIQGIFQPVTHLHLHDWHAAFVLLLRAYHPGYRSLQTIPATYTIHNLALQGIRPFDGNVSCLHAWFPGLPYDRPAVADPRWNAVNPMAVGIRLADRVHTVSPSYAEEILEPSRKPHFHGGEGLENELRQARSQGRLFGILNGCTYPDAPPSKPSFESLLALLRQTIVAWSGTTDSVRTAHFTAYARISALVERGRAPGLLCTSIGRLQPQKALLFKHNGTGPGTGLERMLDALGDRGLLIALGTGDADYERCFTRVCAQRENFLFLNGFSDTCAEALYAAGDLFIMPSSYEPCGISQMLAMRAGQPCLVHNVGGLRDTVTHGRNGFCFDGADLTTQVDQMVAAFALSLADITGQPDQWQTMRRRAADTRFPWALSARKYIRELYG